MEPKIPGLGGGVSILVRLSWSATYSLCLSLQVSVISHMPLHIGTTSDYFCLDVLLTCMLLIMTLNMVQSTTSSLNDAYGCVDVRH